MRILYKLGTFALAGAVAGGSYFLGRSMGHSAGYDQARKEIFETLGKARHMSFQYNFESGFNSDARRMHFLTLQCIDLVRDGILRDDNSVLKDRIGDLENLCGTINLDH